MLNRLNSVRVVDAANHTFAIGTTISNRTLTHRTVDDEVSLIVIDKGDISAYSGRYDSTGYVSGHRLVKEHVSGDDLSVCLTVGQNLCTTTLKSLVAKALIGAGHSRLSKSHTLW